MVSPVSFQIKYNRLVYMLCYRIFDNCYKILGKGEKQYNAIHHYPSKNPNEYFQLSRLCISSVVINADARDVFLSCCFFSFSYIHCKISCMYFPACLELYPHSVSTGFFDMGFGIDWEALV